ncbi:hypothetical protein SOVF_046110 [Spinacia oleracea]|uniref:BAH domain-containing protein n=1 Tax=Spinacia oleracea TaxID=3562 RepID=A0A9R0JLB1_SPIOL|nr:uncharacterized protein LOC110778692 [Spinacia oleracea]KNA21126.1 hypothetical protein SOVF_046110 [Spinacia oleracea]
MVGRIVSHNDNRAEIKKTQLLNETHKPTIEEQSRNCSESEQELQNGAEPIGEVIRVSDNGIERKKHFKAFEYDGNLFKLEDTVLVVPEEGKVKPSVTMIKDIFQIEGEEGLIVRAQRFYRPEEVKKTGGGTWESRDARELFYSSHLDEFPADGVMHECVIHLVPLHKPLPDRKENPGFVVRKFYDYVNQKLRSLTVKDCKGVFPQSV